MALALLLAPMLLLAGCAYKPGYNHNPIARSFAWFSYVNADDIRAYCGAGGPDRYRLIYNAVADEQVRTYDLTVRPDGGADLVVQVSGFADISGGVAFDDLLAPWRGRIDRRSIGRDQLRSLRDALRQSGFDTPPPDGTRVSSWGFFWLVAACEGGRFAYNGWAYPSKRFARLSLQKAVEAVDPTGIPFNPPRPDTEPERDDDKQDVNYDLVVTGQGTKGNFTLF